VAHRQHYPKCHHKVDLLNSSFVRFSFLSFFGLNSLISVDSATPYVVIHPLKFRLLDTESIVSFGGLPNFAGISHSQIIQPSFFNGCIRNILLNPANQVAFLTVFGASTLFSVSTAGTCDPAVRCASTPCQNNGQCIENFDNVTCICQGIYTGPTCAAGKLTQ
jgi:hypothetical protein